MLSSITRFFLAVVIFAAAQSSFAFSLLGPFLEPWQIPQIGYGLSLGEIGGPKNVGEEYRWNTPVLYYAYDEPFLQYFGTSGVTAVDQAIAAFNTLTNYSSYSVNLDEVPMEAARVNLRARALRLMDLKTTAMKFIIEELGLTYADQYVWTLRDRRNIPTLSCPFMEYDTIMRNLDPVTMVYSPYINGTLYSYYILEFCDPPNPLAITIPFAVDPVSNENLPVAALPQRIGEFYTSLTRDDVGGLRYMMRTTNMNYESVSSDSLLVFTNQQSQLLITSNLATLVAQSLTNDPAALIALYPNLVISNTTNFFTNVITTNFTAYFTNKPFAPAYTPAKLVLVTNRTTNAEVRYIHSFANLITNTYYKKGYITTTDTFVTNGGAWTPTGATLVTNTVSKRILTNWINGSFYIIPTNACGMQIIATQLVSTIKVTNTIPALTNIPGVTNIDGQGFRRDIITYFTNYSLVAYPVLCLTNTVSLRQGIDKITFVKTEYDSLLGQFFHPITNTYVLNAVTNSQIVKQTFQRIVTRPDFVFSVEERNAPDFAWLSVGFRTIPNYVTNNIPNANPGGNYGPGTRDDQVIIQFNKVGPLLFNIYDPLNPFFQGLSQGDGQTNFVWGSFDGSTNAPIIYPNGTDIQALENQILFSVGTQILPDAQVGTAYTATLQAVGGQPPLTWSLAPNSPGLPDGLSLAPDGTITGTPTTDGVYDFTVRLTENGGRSVDGDVSITITP